MKKDLLIILAITLISLFVFRKSFNTFFTQDDFLLVNEFSQNSLVIDIKNAIWVPTITHFRPLHNLYFTLSGNLFGKNFFYYHIFTFAIHIAAVFLIYKIALEIFKNRSISATCSLLYAVHPSQFVTLFWISGSATTIGISLLLASFYLYIKTKRGLFLMFYLFSLLASEAMLAGISFYLGYDLFLKKKINFMSLAKLLGVSAIFIFAKIFLLTPDVISNAYNLDLSPKIFKTLTYYSLRIAGFGEVSGDFMESILLLIWLIITLYFLFKKIASKNNYHEILFAIIIVIAGLFPFLLLPNHLSPHYMNISIFGFALLVSLLTSELSLKKKISFTALFVFISMLLVNKTYGNNWVVKRSDTAKKYLSSINQSSIPAGSTIVFNDNEISSSQEAFFSLGTGKALDFYFKDKNYKSCFTWIENCKSVK